MSKSFDAVLAFLGFVMTMSAVGGLDTATDFEVFQLAIVGICGLVVMYLGIENLKEE